MPPERVLEIAARLAAAGAEEVAFGDTTGMANPRQVREFFAAARAALGADVELTAHFHNTRGQGLANVLAALEAGIDSRSSRASASSAAARSPPGATGNIATEDLVSMLHEMGDRTGIDLAALLECSRARCRRCSAARWAATPSSRGPVEWADAPARGWPALARRARTVP